MGTERDYSIWIDWAAQIVSLFQVSGFDRIPFATPETLQHNLQLLLAEGFRFQ